MRSKIPRKKKLFGEKDLEKARLNDEKSRLDRKEKFDAKKKTVDVVVQVGDTVLVKQTKTTTKPPFDPSPYTVIEVNGTRAVLERFGKTKKRSFNKIKVLKGKEKEKLRKERKKSMDEAAGGETRREDPKREISKNVSRRPRTDSDNDDDFELFYRWETTTPTIPQRAELIEIDEEENAEAEEEVFHGFEQREVEEALELQAILRK